MAGQMERCVSHEKSGRRGDCLGRTAGNGERVARHQRSLSNQRVRVHCLMAPHLRNMMPMMRGTMPGDGLQLPRR
jgi:hypothetical protein